MLLAMGWAIVRSSRAPYEAVEGLEGTEIDDVDDAVDQADDVLFDALERYLKPHQAPDLEWQFRRRMNNHSGMLHFHSSRNHRGVKPTAIELLEWLAEHGPGSFGLAYLHDDEDVRDGTDHSNEFRVWRLCGGSIEELSDPFLSPIVPNLNPTWLA